MRKIFRNSIVFLSVFLIQTTSIFAFYSDVVPQSLFYDAVKYFSSELPILDQNKESFKPLTPVTKAEFFKLVIASTGYEPSIGMHETPFKDISGDEWFAPYIKKALDSNFIRFSDENPYFNPADSITRAEAIEKIINFHQLNVPQSTFKNYDYIDVEGQDPYATISQIAYELKLMHDHKSRTFYPNKAITRAETVHVLYKVKESGLGSPKSDYLKPSFISGIDNDITSRENFYIFLDVWDKITNEYVEREDIDEDMLIYGAISGMINELNDPYSSFFTPVEATNYFETLEGTVEGIGIYLIIEDEEIKIITPIKGSPADKEGLKPNDIIIEIDDFPTTGLTLAEVINMIRGEPGSSIKLKIKRNSETIDKTITRENIDIPYVESEIRNGIGIIYYNQFTANSHKQFVNEIEKIEKENPKGLILDLRNNPGGYLYSAKQLISHFLDEGEAFVKIIFADGKEETHFSFGPGELKQYQTVVLINEGSASASEIVALCLKENKMEIIGKNSFGKDKIQSLFTYNQGASLKLSTAKWTSAQGTEVHKSGIVPDYTVEIKEEDISSNRDPQLKKAMNLIK